METYNRPATKSAENNGHSNHQHERRKSQGDFGRKVNYFPQNRGHENLSSHHGKADAYHKKESKRKVNQGVKNHKWNKDKGTSDGSQHKASHVTFTKPRPLALEGNQPTAAYSGLPRRLDSNQHDNRLENNIEPKSVPAESKGNGSRFVSFNRYDIENGSGLDRQRVALGSINRIGKHTAVHFQQPSAEKEDSAPETLRLQKESASLMGSRGQFSSNIQY